MSAPHSRELRKGRWSEPGQIYLVTTRTAGSRPLFSNLDSGRVVVSALRWHDHEGYTLTWTFVVMPDHLHWLFELGEGSSLSGVVGRVKSYSSKIINLRRRATGRVWQHGFHDHALRKEEDLKAVARYVVMNPVRAGLVSSPRTYSLWDARWLR